jgi:flagellar assembly protein FliH
LSRVIKAEDIRLQSEPEPPTTPQSRRPTPQRQAILDAAQITKAARDRARALLEGAQARAVEIITEAADKAAEQEETAFRQGYQRGHAEGKEEFLDQIKGQLDKLETILQQAMSVRQAAMELAEEDLIKLSLLIAEKIVRKEIQLDSEVTKRVLTEAISYLGGATKIFVRVNRRDLPTLEEGEDEIRRLFLEAKAITFIEDESIQPGGCIIETDLGRIDARLETRLDLMKKELLEVMEGD